MQNEEDKNEYTEQSCGKSFARRFEKSQFYKKTMEELKIEIDGLHASEEQGQVPDKNNIVYSTSCFTQVSNIVILFKIVAIFIFRYVYGNE